MKGGWVPIVLVVAGGVLYHAAQKSVQRTASPLAVVIQAYGLGIVLCLMAGMIEAGGRWEWLSPRRIDWAVIGIGVGAVLIEIGFMLTYRAGWDLGVASVFGNIAIAVVLLPVGLLFFREPLTVRTVAGLLCCLAGMVLLSRR
jgi:drug/metabolite transporter (DMT)-like permease